MRYLLSLLVVAASVCAVCAQTVDPFTGEFSYDINVLTVPGPSGSGFSLNIHYSSDVRSEDEASMVGYGWNISLPMIHRSRKGLPDDYKDVEVKGTHTVPPRNSFSIKPWYYPEVFKNDLASDPVPPASQDLELIPQTSLTIEYDSETGMDLTFGVGLKAKYGNLMGSASIDDELNGGFGVNYVFGGRTVEGDVYASGIGVSVPFSPTRLPAYRSSALQNIDITSTSYQTTFKWGDVSHGDEVGANVLWTEYSILPKDRQAFGYLYAYSAIANNNVEALLDYSVEKAGTPEGMSRPYAPTPMPDFDSYYVNAPGLNGSFRAHHRFPLEMYSPKVDETSKLRNVHVAVSLGQDLSIGVGGSLSIGSAFPQGEMLSSIHEPLPIGEGGRSLGAIPRDKLETEQMPFCFRYIGDKADALTYASSDDPILGSINGGMGLGSFHERNRDRPVRSNSYVRPLFSTSIAVEQPPSSGKAISEGSILGFQLTDADGNEWSFEDRTIVWSDASKTYVLRNEADFSKMPSRIYYADAGRNPTAYYEESHGFEMPGPYVEAYLATGSTTPDYVDVTGNGITSDDLGGWTRYNWSLTSNDYQTRSPYNGYFFDRGALDDKKDDKLSCVRQTKQIKVLQSIETQSHKAILKYSGTDNFFPRLDGWQAQKEIIAQTSALTKENSNKNVYLARIDLYKKVAGGGLLPVRSTHFSYDYSLAPGNPSSGPVVPPATGPIGKLTLRRVWFEDHEVEDAFIEPIEFHYTYPVLSSSEPTSSTHINIDDIGSRYTSVSVPSDISSTNQNPTFNPEKTDAWGYYGAKGVAAAIPFYGDVFHLPYDYTPERRTASDYAAPYTLKRITLPSGAEIVPVYEPRDYGWVQDSTAMDMYPLLSTSTDGPFGSVLHISLAGVDVSTDASKVDDYVANVKRRFDAEDNDMFGKERLYLRFLYGQNLPNFRENSVTPATSSIRSYVVVKDVIKIPDANGQPVLQITLNNKYGGPADEEVRDYLEFGEHGPWSRALLAFQDAARKHFHPTLDGGVINIAADLIAMIFGDGCPPSMLPGDDLEPVHHPALLKTASYVRLPSMRAKQGGGPRVRTLYTISPNGSLQDGDANIVGTQYDYRNYLADGSKWTSGVVTQEPIAMREQMGIVQVNPRLLEETRDGQALREVDIARLEMPLGESLLPAPMVGHSRVVTTSLFDGLTKSPTTIHKFLTTRDQPSVTVKSSKREERKSRFPDILNILVDISNEDVEIEQGFAFNVHDVMGAPSSVETYVGREPTTLPSYPPPTEQDVSDAVLATATYYEYVPRDEEVLLLDTITRPLRYGNPGADMDIVTEHKHVELDRQNLTLEFGVSWTYPFKFLVGVFPRYESHNSHVYSYVTSKICRKPLHLRRIHTVADGASDSSVVVALDAKTGAEAIVQSHDTYHGVKLGGSNDPHVGTITTVTVPALRAEPGMASRAEAEGMRFGMHNGEQHPDFPHYRDGQVWTGLTAMTTMASVITVMIPIADAEERQIRSNNFIKLFTIGDIVSIRIGTSTLERKISNITVGANGTFYLHYSGGSFFEPFGVITHLTIKSSARRNMIAAPLSITTLYGVNLSSAMTHAQKLRSRERTAEMLNDWIRGGHGASGMYWERPLARYSVATNGSLTNMEAINYLASGLGGPYINQAATGSCALEFKSMFDVVMDQINFQPAPASRTIRMRYLQRVVDANNPDNCLSVVPPGYECTLPFWTRWRLFGVSDIGDLVTGSDVGPLSVRTTNELFGFRSELHNQAQQPDEWDRSSLSAVPAMISLENVIASHGYRYVRTTASSTSRPTYRIESAYQARTSETSNGDISGDPYVWNSAGTFDLAAPFAPPAISAPPSELWYLQSKITSWNSHGAPCEYVGPEGIVQSVLYNESQRLPSVIATGTPKQFIWSDDGESTGTDAAAHTGSKSAAASSGSPYMRYPNLPALNDERVLGTTYTARLWLKHTCPVADLDVTFQSTSVDLESGFIGAVDDWRLYEFTVSGQCSTLAVSYTGGGSESIYVDDVLIRPSESTASSVVYDVLDRPVAILDDDGWPTIYHYDARGRHIRTSVESIRGRDVVSESSLWLRSHRRQESEVAGGGAQAMIGQPLQEGFEEILGQSPFSIPSLSPTGLRAKERLLDIKLTPQKQQIRALPDDDVTPKVKKSANDQGDR